MAKARKQPSSEGIEQELDAIGKKLDLPEASAEVAADESALMAAARDYGKELSPFASAAAEAVAGCGEPFASLSVSVSQLREQDARLQRLLRSKGRVDALSARISGATNVLRVELSRSVGLVLQATDATLAHPGASPVKERLLTAAEPLLSLRDGRRAGITAAQAATRALKLEQEGREGDKDARIAALEATVAEQSLQLKFLAGEPLRPADLRAPAPAPAARTGRRGRTRTGRRTPR